MKHGIRTWCAQTNARVGRAEFLVQMAVKNCFIRGSVVRYVQLPTEHVDTQLLEDATRRGALAVRVILNRTDRPSCRGGQPQQEVKGLAMLLWTFSTVSTLGSRYIHLYSSAALL